MSQPPPQLVIFDFDGTLFDTHISISQTLALVFREKLPHGTQPPTEDSIARSISSGASLPATIEQIYPRSRPDSALQPHVLQDFLMSYRTKYDTHGLPLVKPFAHTNELLTTLKSLSIPTAIVSNKGVAAVRAVLAQYKLSSFIDLVIGDGEPPGIPRKPDPGSWTHAVRPFFEGQTDFAEPRGTIPLKAESVLMVGDTKADIQYARNIGAKIVWCRYGYGSEDECLALKPDFIVDGLDEITQIIDKP